MAKAFLDGLTGKKAETPEEQAERVATYVHAHMLTGDRVGATALVLAVAQQGLATACDLITKEGEGHG
jgi:hypothetical protein